MAIARKELSKVFKEDKETVINERYDFDFDTSIQEKIEEIFEDWEYARDHGVYWGEDDLCFIEVSPLLEECEYRAKENTDELEEDEVLKETDIINYLKKWKEFTIWL